MSARCARGMITQSVIFPKSFGVKRARAWLVKHGSKSGKVHATKGSLRFRQVAPSACQRGDYATIPMGKTGIKKIICCPK